MSRSLKYEIPGMDRQCTPLDLSERGCRGVFAPDLLPPFQLVVEIGFGRGEFLLDIAAKRPGTGFLGVEVSFKRTLKMARKVARAGLSNVRLIEARGEMLVKDLLDAASVDEMWINFSDPWPKDRHDKRRLIRSEFVSDVARCLAPDAVLHIATDNAPYAEQIDAVLSAEPLLENAFAPDPWRAEIPGRMQTGYEAEWRAEGRPLHFFAHQRRAARAPM